MSQDERKANLALMERIDKVFMAYPFYGLRKMMRQLHREGIRVGRHRVRLMGLEAVYQAPRTSNPHRDTGFIPICSEVSQSFGPTKYGVRIAPTSLSETAFCTWWRS